MSFVECMCDVDLLCVCDSVNVMMLEMMFVCVFKCVYFIVGWFEFECVLCVVYGGVVCEFVLLGVVGMVMFDLMVGFVLWSE